MIAQQRGGKVSFFSAWDFHLPPPGGFELIELNDNGSGFLFAAIINALCYEAATMAGEKELAAPDSIADFHIRIDKMVRQEAEAFFGARPMNLLLILDDAESLRQGKFRTEHRLLCDLARKRMAG